MDSLISFPPPSAMTTLYCARWVLPISSAAIAEGAIAVDGQRIIAVAGRVALVNGFPHATVRDFGESAIIPGLGRFQPSRHGRSRLSGSLRAIGAVLRSLEVGGNESRSSFRKTVRRRQPES